MKRLSEHGEDTSVVEVTNVSSRGIWIWVRGKELFMSYEDFPWFKEENLKKILNVNEIKEGHLYWPDLDVDLSLDMIEHPEKYPLISNKT